MEKLEEIKLLCEMFINNYYNEYKEKPIKGQDNLHAMMCGMAIAAENVLEIINKSEE